MSPLSLTIIFRNRFMGAKSPVYPRKSVKPTEAEIASAIDPILSSSGEVDPASPFGSPVTSPPVPPLASPPASSIASPPASPSLASSPASPAGRSFIILSLNHNENYNLMIFEPFFSLFEPLDTSLTTDCQLVHACSICMSTSRANVWSCTMWR